MAVLEKKIVLLCHIWTQCYKTCQHPTHKSQVLFNISYFCYFRETGLKTLPKSIHRPSFSRRMKTPSKNFGRTFRTTSEKLIVNLEMKLNFSDAPNCAFDRWSLPLFGVCCGVNQDILGCLERTAFGKGYYGFNCTENAHQGCLQGGRYSKERQWMRPLVMLIFTVRAPVVD